MSENNELWEEYKNKVKEIIASGDQERINKMVERNLINMGRAGPTTLALLTLLQKKDIIDPEEISKIVDEQIKKEIDYLKGYQTKFYKT